MKILPSLLAGLKVACATFPDARKGLAAMTLRLRDVLEARLTARGNKIAASGRSSRYWETKDFTYT